MRERVGEEVACRRLGVLLLASSPPATSDPYRRRWNHEQGKEKMRDSAARRSATRYTTLRRRVLLPSPSSHGCRRQDSKGEKLEERERSTEEGFVRAAMPPSPFTVADPPPSTAPHHATSPPETATEA
ncbi:uncharacterized protein DS421_3g70710 [Arachis hypogaea]|nr:uncharacterized protein DS421_3g70710 [Arachis hypogaea]